MLELVGSSARSWMPKPPAPGFGTFWSCQVAPLSVERQRPNGTALADWQVAMVPLLNTPMVVEAQSVVALVVPAVSGSMTILATALPVNGPGFWKALPGVPPRSVQVAPPSAERRMPWPD